MHSHTPRQKCMATHAALVHRCGNVRPVHQRCGNVRPVQHQCVQVQRMAYSRTDMCATARRRGNHAGVHPRPGLGNGVGIATNTIRLKSSNASVQSCQNTTMGQTRRTTNNEVATASCPEKDGEMPRKRLRRKRQQLKSTSVGAWQKPI